MIRWFSSDLHLGDPWAARRRYCGDDVEKMNNWLASRWDKTIGEDDTVFLLGDVAAGMPLEQVAEWITARPGRKHLILGNQDLDEDPNDRAWLAAGFDSVAMEARIMFHQTEVTLSHYPLVDHGGVVFHGHTHSPTKVAMSDLDTILVHVGWEAWRRYVPERDILDAIMNGG